MFPDVSFTLARLNWNSVVDILLVALIFYWMLILVQGTKAVQLLRGILFLVVVAVTITGIFDLTAFRWLINNSLPALLVAIPVIFQPELRRALERLGRTGNILARANQTRQLEATLDTAAAVAGKLALKSYGALIVLERETGLEDYIETGVRLEAQVSEELLLTIFFPNTALHDGAVIIRHDRVIAASCLLPLSRLGPDGYHLGTRHRASIGLTEATDAIVIVVSEETGIISVSHDGRMIRNLDQARLLKILKAFYRAQLTQTTPSWLKFRRKLPSGKP
ncbi:MAG: diadenylate cyclase CdaA [Anaerolineae bacterium]